MGTFVFSSSTGTGLSSLTLGSAKALVARIVGGQDSPDKMGAVDAIRLAIGKLNEYDWSYLLVTGSNITTVAGTAAYSLPTAFKHQVSLRLESPHNRPLAFIRRDLYDKMRYDQTANSFPTHYTMFNKGQSAQFSLLPTPDDVYTVSLKYYRPVSVPSSDTNSLDITEQMERVLITQAQMLMAMWVRPEMVRAIAGVAEDALRGALGTDRTEPDEDEGLTPSAEHGTVRWGPNDTIPYFQDW